MKNSRLKTLRLNFSDMNLNLADSPYMMGSDQAVLLRNVDFDENRGAIVGRHGTTTVNPAGILKHGGNPSTPNDYEWYQCFDLFRCLEPVSGNKYLLTSYDDLTNFKLGYLRTNHTAQTYFTTITAAAGAVFNLTRNHRIHFVEATCPTNGPLVMGFNGYDQPFWISLATGIAHPFAFGGSGLDYRLLFVLPEPWMGHIWATGRTGEETTWQWSDVVDYTKFVGEGTTSGFRQAPQNERTNPARAGAVFQNRLIAFNLNSIGEFYPTGDLASPFRYRELARNVGTIHPKSIYKTDRGIVFLDKRPPYLKMFNGSTLETLDPSKSLEKGIQNWLDASTSELLLTRIGAIDSNLLLSFKSQSTYAPTGTDGQRWTAAINMNRRNRMGQSYYPMNMWSIRMNDLCSSDEGTDFGQCWYTDPDPVANGGKNYYFVRRILGWYDVRAGGVGYGDKRGMTLGGQAVTPTNITYLLRTGFLNFGTDIWKELMTFKLVGEWEGTITSGAKFYVRYRCEKWTVWKYLEINAVSLYAQEIPFDLNDQGQAVQFEFSYTDKASRPILHQIELQVRPKPGVLT